MKAARGSLLHDVAVSFVYSEHAYIQQLICEQDHATSLWGMPHYFGDLAQALRRQPILFNPCEIAKKTNIGMKLWIAGNRPRHRDQLLVGQDPLALDQNDISLRINGVGAGHSSSKVVWQQVGGEAASDDDI
jgi:hypothetical protein